MSAQDIRIQCCPSFDGIEEIADVEGIEFHTRTGSVKRIGSDIVLHFFHQLALQVIYLITVATFNQQGSCFTIEDDTHAAAFRVLAVARPAFPADEGVVGKLEVNNLCVWCFPIVLVAVSTASRSDACGIVDSKTPAGKVNHVRAVVQGFAGSPMPEPMPVIMDEVVFVCFSGCGSLPELIIKPGGHFSRFAHTNGFAVIGIPGFGVIGATNHTCFQLSDGSHHIGPGAALVAHLQEFVVFGGCLHQHFPFIGIVATRLFQVNVFTRRYSQKGSRSMPVVGCRNNKQIQVFILQGLPEITFCNRFFTLCFFHCSYAFVHCPVVYITNMGHFTFLLRSEIGGNR